MNVLIRTRFGVAVDPWGQDMATADAVRAGHLVQAALGSKLLVSIAGARGAGKTRAVRGALGGGAAQLVEPLRLDREKLHMGDIQAALVRELAPEETLRRSGEARSGQTRRILGAAAAKGPVLLWIDDAHLLHHSTLRGLKRLREITWRGVGPLLGIVLTGQTDRVSAIPEVGLRSDRMTFAGLTAGEAERAIVRALGALVSRADAVALATSPRARNWLDLSALIDACLVGAAARGEDRVTPACVATVLGAAPATAASARPAPASDAAVAAYLRQQVAA